MHCFLQGSHLDGDSAWSACIEGCIRVVNKKPTLKDRTFSFNGVSIGQPLLEDMAGTLIFFDKTASAVWNRSYQQLLVGTPEPRGRIHRARLGRGSRRLYGQERLRSAVRRLYGRWRLSIGRQATRREYRLPRQQRGTHHARSNLSCLFQYLSVISPVFCAMFSDKYTEGNKEGIPLHDIKAEDFKQFLMAVYPMRQPITGMHGWLSWGCVGSRTRVRSCHSLAPRNGTFLENPF